MFLLAKALAHPLCQLSQFDFWRSTCSWNDTLSLILIFLPIYVYEYVRYNKKYSIAVRSCNCLIHGWKTDCIQFRLTYKWLITCLQYVMPISLFVCCATCKQLKHHNNYICIHYCELYNINETIVKLVTESIKQMLLNSSLLNLNVTDFIEWFKTEMEQGDFIVFQDVHKTWTIQYLSFTTLPYAF